MVFLPVSDEHPPTPPILFQLLVLIIGQQNTLILITHPKNVLFLITENRVLISFQMLEIPKMLYKFIGSISQSYNFSVLLIFIVCYSYGSRGVTFATDAIFPIFESFILNRGPKLFWRIVDISAEVYYWVRTQLFELFQQLSVIFSVANIITISITP